IHSQQSEEINDANIEGFKSGAFKYLVNVDKLTEGFNARDIDCIILLRSTMSPGLYYQMVGRGLRLHPSKEDCLILDFGRNIETHGPIDRIEIRKKKDGTREVTTAPQKECPECHQLLFISVMVCPTCGYRFPEQDKHEETASTADIISKWKKPEVHTVQRVEYNRHEKHDKPDSMRVDYYIGLFDKYSEYVCLDHEGFARTKALQWILARNTEDVPEPITTVDLALAYCHLLKKPTQITVNINGKFPQIIGYNFKPLPEPEKSETKNWTNELEINEW
ncbi:MAG: helicase-related protein, partial [Candidatus Hodarchaeota archaeon]